jgi:hypothetical protein
MELSNKLLDTFGMHEVFLKPFKNRCFDGIAANREQVIAGPFVSGRGTPIVMLADFGVTAATNAAPEKTG